MLGVTVCKGPFTQSISGNANANAKMGTEPIHFVVSVLLLTLTLCVNRIIYNANTHLKLDALCERAINVRVHASTQACKMQYPYLQYVIF